MAIPSKDKTFGIESCKDILSKLEWEIQQLRGTQENELEYLMYRAFNGAVTAWHLGDWVWSDMTEQQQATLSDEWGLPAPSKADFLYALRVRNRSLAVCREIATASKHVVVSRSPDVDVQTRVSAVASHVTSDGKAVRTESNDSVVVTGWKLKVTDGSKSHDFADTLDGALSFWTAFIYERKIAADL